MHERVGVRRRAETGRGGVNCLLQEEGEEETPFPECPNRRPPAPQGVETSQEGETSDLELAKELARTCYLMYRDTPAGLAPEIVHFRKQNTGHPKQHRNDIGNGYFEV